MDQASCFQPDDGFAQRSTADTKAGREIDFVDRFPGRNAALHDRLHDLIKDAVGERYAGDGPDR
jgi:hypothetical protein